MKRLFNKNKTGYEPTPFLPESQPTQQPLGGYVHAPGPTSQQLAPAQGSYPSDGVTPRQSGPSHPSGLPSSRQSPDPQAMLQSGGSPAHLHPQSQHHSAGHLPSLSASASAKKWFSGLNGKGSGYDQITPFTMPDQLQQQQKSSTSVDRHSFHDGMAAHNAQQRQTAKYSGLESSLGRPSVTAPPKRSTETEGHVPPPAEQGGANMKRRVSLREHVPGRMFGWTSAREKHKEKEKKNPSGLESTSELQPTISGGAKVISGMRYEDTAHPSSGQPTPVGKDSLASHSSAGHYANAYTPTSVTMSRATTQSADPRAERRQSSDSIGRREHAHYPMQESFHSSASGGFLPPPLPLSQQPSRSSQQSGRHQYTHSGNGGLPPPLAPGMGSASPGNLTPEQEYMQRPLSSHLTSNKWSPATSEHELLAVRNLVPGGADLGSPGVVPLSASKSKSPSGRESYLPLGSPPAVLGQNVRPASPLYQHIEVPQPVPYSKPGLSGLHPHGNQTMSFERESRPSTDQRADSRLDGGFRSEEAHRHEEGKHGKKKGLFAFVAGKEKEKHVERDKEKQSDWGGFLRKKETRIEYRGPEYTDHTTMTDASYSEVMPTTYAGVNQPVKVVEPTKKDKELAIREGQERTREAQKIDKYRAKEEEKRMRDEERKAREEEKERARLEKEQMKKEEKVAKGNKDPKSVSFEIDELCKTAFASDLSKIYNIGDKLSRCDRVVHKEAVHATRKQIKHGTTQEAKIFALKIWLLISDFDRSDSGFRVTSFEKKFVTSVEDQLLLTSEETRLPQPTYERMKDTLSHLCHHYGRLPGGENLRNSWQKVKAPDEPQEGYPFPENHPVFSPDDPLLRQSTSFSSQTRLQNLETNLPNEIQELSRLVDECETGKGHARALHEALLLDSRHLETPEMIEAQEQLESQMSWANAQAEKSRLERGLTTPADIDMTFEDHVNGLQIDRNTKDDHLPLAERAFVDLLAASDELTNVIKLHGDAERALREQKEIRYAQEKSKTDTRMGRSPYTAGLSVPYGGDANAGTSLSRSPSPSAAFKLRNPAQAQDNPYHLARSGAHSPYANGTPLSRTPTTAESIDMPPPRFPEDGRSESPPRNGARLQGPRPFRERGKHGSSASIQSSQQYHSSSPQNNFIVRNGNDDEEDEEALSRPPARPSAKAVGKRPAVIKETSSFDPDDLWKVDDPKPPESPADSDDQSFEDWLLRKPEKYVYDAMQDKEVQRQIEELRKKEMESSKRKTLEAGYGGSQYTASAATHQLLEVSKALVGEVPSKSPAGSRNNSRAASPVPQHGGLLRGHSSKWKWRK
ncbi:hypothetical protein QFC22_005358 [Naganishia vaughanmartiniae]|uniref:Uncharacterized protein n=1 Tax=Naganishia vaughanmartiniae TaxID=1424756 RepID=A0ACC2WTE6_9TREE|nr:hypothetical protein QFC22_005358 [Naganishia vaughanmartiniae]